MCDYKSNEKMDIGDIGFLLIAFIVFIVNFIVKANKDKGQADTQKPAKPELPEPWEVQETLPPLIDNPFNREKMIEVITKRTQLPPIFSSKDSFKNTKTFMQASQEGLSSLSESLYVEDEEESIIYRQDESAGESFTDGLMNGDISQELKKAIIYSEILHRKYE